MSGASNILVLIFGILGNLLSFMVYIAPLPTFYGIYRMKSTRGFHSIPYVFALLSAMMWIYYALIKSNSNLLITINSIGCVIEIIYIGMFFKYAPKPVIMLTAKLLLLFNVGGFSLIVLLTLFLSKGAERIYILGWVSVVVASAVFAAPLSIVRVVVKTKSVEFMPFPLSLTLTLSAVMWFFYGMARKDYFVAVPNIIGFIFGIIQMGLYAKYRGNKGQTEELPEEILEVIKQNTIANGEEHAIDIYNHVHDDQKIVNEEGEVVSISMDSSRMDSPRVSQTIHCEV